MKPHIYRDLVGSLIIATALLWMGSPEQASASWTSKTKEGDTVTCDCPTWRSANPGQTEPTPCPCDLTSIAASPTCSPGDPASSFTSSSLGTITMCTNQGPVAGGLLVDAGFDSSSQPLLSWGSTVLNRWAQEQATLVVGAQLDGVSPLEGDGMLRIQNSGGGTGSQVAQIIDVTPWAGEIASGDVYATAYGALNASLAGTFGGVTVVAIAASGDVPAYGTFPLDGDPGTWEDSFTTVVLPADTTEIRVQYSFTNAQLPFGQSGYGDSGFVVLVQDGVVIAPSLGGPMLAILCASLIAVGIAAAGWVRSKRVVAL